MSRLEKRSDRGARSVVPLVVLVFVVYCVSGWRRVTPYDYTLRVAEALLSGHLGLSTAPPPWLNEMIPKGGVWYSAFPLGSVLTMLPVAVMKKLGLISAFPGTLIAATFAAVTFWLTYGLTARHDFTTRRRYLLALLPVMATWMWANLAFAGAWQIALGVAVTGQLAALYFLLVRENFWLAGVSFAFAFGNRTEVLLLAPLFFFMIWRKVPAGPERAKLWFQCVLRFSIAPCLLGLATLAYNYARFGSPADFGYARIPGVLLEPWYRDGIFSVTAIPRNAREMLWAPWRKLNAYPYFLPTGWGGSIFLSCPSLLFLLRPSARDKELSWLAAAAILVLTFVLWCHGNPGGWQYSYRYAMVLLPWMLIILIESSPKRVTHLEALLFGASVTINAWATYLFLQSDFMRY